MPDNHQPLVSPEWLAQHLHDPDLAILDVRLVAGEDWRAAFEDGPYPGRDVHRLRQGRLAGGQGHGGRHAARRGGLVGALRPAWSCARSARRRRADGRQHRRFQRRRPGVLDPQGRRAPAPLASRRRLGGLARRSGPAGRDGAGPCAAAKPISGRDRPGAARRPRPGRGGGRAQGRDAARRARDRLFRGPREEPAGDAGRPPARRRAPRPGAGLRRLPARAEAGRRARAHLFRRAARARWSASATPARRRRRTGSSSPSSSAATTCASTTARCRSGPQDEKRPVETGPA